LEVEEEGLQDCSSNKWYQSEKISEACAAAVRCRCEVDDGGSG
jgi:hypothetical protein